MSLYVCVCQSLGYCVYDAVLFSSIIFQIIDACGFLNLVLPENHLPFDYSRFPKEIQDFSPDRCTTLALDSEVQYGKSCVLELLCPVLVRFEYAWSVCEK